jgi:hypothetical protein
LGGETEKAVNGGWLLLDLLSDPDKARFVDEVLQGREAHPPTDGVLHLRYKAAALAVLRASADRRPGLERLVRAARIAGYSDEDHAQADFTPPDA